MLKSRLELGHSKDSFKPRMLSALAILKLRINSQSWWTQSLASKFDVDERCNIEVFIEKDMGIYFGMGSDHRHKAAFLLAFIF